MELDAMPTSFKVVIPQFGPAETLEIVEAELAAPADNEVQVEGMFASINPIDVKTRAGLGWAAQSNKDNLPWTPGYDLVGKVLAVGDSVSGFSIGDHVVGFIGFPLEAGAYAQRLNVVSQELLKVPNSITFEAAAALPLAGLTAMQAVQKASIEPGQSVLILGGAGGVGHIAVQLAVATGADVYTTCGATNLDYMATLGATAINYHVAPASEQLQGVDVLIDLIGGDVALDAMKCLKSGSRVITIPTITADKIKAEAENIGVIAEGMLVEPNTEQLTTLLNMVGDGSLKIDIQTVYSMADVVKAHQQVETGHTRGKVLLDLSLSH
jgi:NADPH2:quinone reductase